MDPSSTGLGDRGMRDGKKFTFYVTLGFFLLLWVSTTLMISLLLFLCLYLVAATDCIYARFFLRRKHIVYSHLYFEFIVPSIIEML